LENGRALLWFPNPNNTAGREVARTINAYALSFLNKHLKGEDDHLLDARSADYPRVGNFRKE